MVQKLEKEYQFIDFYHFLQTFSPIFANLCINLCQFYWKFTAVNSKNLFP